MFVFVGHGHHQPHCLRGGLRPDSGDEDGDIGAAGVCAPQPQPVVVDGSKLTQLAPGRKLCFDRKCHQHPHLRSLTSFTSFASFFTLQTSFSSLAPASRIHSPDTSARRVRAPPSLSPVRTPILLPLARRPRTSCVARSSRPRSGSAAPCRLAAKTRSPHTLHLMPPRAGFSSWAPANL